MRDEFDMALNLISLLSSRSTAIMHLWNRLRGLRDLQAKLSRETTATTGNLSQAETVVCAPPSIEDLSFDELFPGFQSDPARSEPTELAHDQLMSPVIRDQINSLLDGSIGAEGLVPDFTFPY